MQVFNKKGFLLMDALIGLAVVCAISILFISVVKMKENFLEGYDSYQIKSAQNYYDIYHQLSECEICIVDSKDSSPYDT